MPTASTTTLPSWHITMRAAAIRVRGWNIACGPSSSTTTAGHYAEAVAQFETGLELLQKLPDDDRRAELELDLRNAVFLALMTTKGYASLEAEQSAARAMVLCQRPGINWEKTWSALYAVFVVHLARPDLRKACEIAAEMLARAEEHETRGPYCGRGELFGVREDGLGRLPARRPRLRPGVGAVGIHREVGDGPTPVARRAAPPWREVFNRISSAQNLWFLGYPDRSLERLSIATAIANESRSKLVLEWYTTSPPTFMSYAASLST